MGDSASQPHYGSKLRRMLDDSAVKQSELAARIRVDQSTLSKWKRMREFRHVQAFLMLLKLLGTTPEQFFGAAMSNTVTEMVPNPELRIVEKLMPGTENEWVRVRMQEIRKGDRLRLWEDGERVRDHKGRDEWTALADARLTGKGVYIGGGPVWGVEVDA